MGCTMLRSKSKTAIRWFSIVIVSFFYYLLIAIASLSFGHIHEKESMLFADKTISIEYHRASLDAVLEATNVVYWAAIIGFPVCMILILIIFKKIR